MAEAAVTFLLENVRQLLQYNRQVRDYEDELQRLTDELGLLKDFLQDAAQRPKKEELFRQLERQIREVIYDAEDTIDSVPAHAAKGAKTGAKIGCMPRINIRGVLAKEINCLTDDKVKPLLERVKMDFTNMQIRDGSDASIEGPSTEIKKVQSISKDNIVGFKDEEETIINYLMEEREKLDVISLIGMPGLGKTTLAWKIFQSHRIQYEFSTRIWVHVSQKNNLRNVLLDIVKAFTMEDISGMSEEELALTVRARLGKGKFLLVMDDIWTVEVWNRIQQALPKSNWNGKVLITSRNKKVGNHASVTRKPHMMRFLTEEESWELLQLEVFGVVHRCPVQLKHKGEWIARQCDGLPLAIVVIGGILQDIVSKKEDMNILDAWDELSQNTSTYIMNNRECKISEIFALSYNSLPQDLRNCFLYLGVFPEDYEIPVWTLIRLWIAEGFIYPKEGKSLEEIAEDNLKDLIDMNLVMIGKTNPNGQLKSCRVLDVVHQFCISEAATQEQNLFQEIKQIGGVLEPPLSDICMYPRLCIHSHLMDFLSNLPSSKAKDQRIRSFLCFNREPFILDAKYNTIIPDAFNLLRVLDSNSFKFIGFPMKVTRLIHLRYLTLSIDGEIDVLPQDVSQLWNLQTLVVDTKSRRLEIKATIWKLIQLRHLKTKAQIILAIKRGAGDAGENLQTLSRLSPECCTKDVFRRARNLKKLGIRGSIAIVLKAGSLKKLDRLENLKLVNDCEPASEEITYGFPRPNCFPRYIKRLTLSATHWDWTHMSTLAKIVTLEVLKLKDSAFKGKSWCVDGGFSRLQFLLIDSTDLVCWEASDDQFPTLSCLVLKNCQELNQIPLGLARSLQVLDVQRVAKSVVVSARTIEKQKKQMQGTRRGDQFKLSIGSGCE